MWNLRTPHEERGVRVGSAVDALMNGCFGFSPEKMETVNSGRVENNSLKSWGISAI